MMHHHLVFYSFYFLRDLQCTHILVENSGASRVSVGGGVVFFSPFSGGGLAWDFWGLGGEFVGFISLS